MKNVAFFSLLISAILFTGACKNENKSDESNSAHDLAVADTLSTSSTPEYLYVTAFSGLTLREFNNLNSEKVAIMPYGTRVRVITPEEHTTMTVAGISGGMHEVEYNHKKGYAFNGYLSKFFPPEEDMKPKVYAEELKSKFPEVRYTESAGGTASKPTTQQSILLPTQQWHEAFYIAQRLFKIPAEFAFPLPAGSKEEVVKDRNNPNQVLTSELLINRNDNGLKKLQYTYQAKNFGYIVTLTAESNGMLLERTESAQ